MTLHVDSLLVGLILAHLTGDFILQSQRMLEAKKRLGGQVAHAALHALLVVPVLVLLSEAAPVAVLLAAVAIGTTHGLLDTAKSIGSAAYRESWWGHLIDQALHVTILIAVASILAGATTPPPIHRALLLAAAVISATRMGQFLVAKVLLVVPHDAKTSPGAGAAIGNIERLLVLLLVLLGEYVGIGIIVAAKSVARWKELGDQEFAEYYLVGTLTSITWAIGVGVAARLLW